MLEKLFRGGKPGRKKPARPGKLTYESARETLESTEDVERKALAERNDAPPEALYYLASDADAAVRAKVAANPATPRQADILLVEDVSEDVRCELARKIGRLIPELDTEEAEKVRDMTLDVLDALSRDQLPRVRAILADEMAACASAPRDVVLRLVKDETDAVALPVLEYSPLLNDTDLMELIAAGLASVRLDAIARRDDLSEDVSDEIAATLDVTAIATLLRNRSASIRQGTLNKLAEQAEQMKTWHEPIALRPELSMRAMRRIAGFVAAELVAVLADRSDLDTQTREFLSKRVRARIAGQKPAPPEKMIASEPAGEPESDPDRDDGPAAVVGRAADAGRLNEEFVVEAMRAGEKDIARHALARLAEISFDATERMIRSGSAKAACALAWKAGLSMTAALLVQEKLLLLPVRKRLVAGDDAGYPLDADEMTWQVECFVDEE